jgi:hypothetical protein
MRRGFEPPAKRSHPLLALVSGARGPGGLPGGVVRDRLDGRGDARDSHHQAEGLGGALGDAQDWLSGTCETADPFLT